MFSRPPVIIAGAVLLLIAAIFVWLATPSAEVAHNLQSQKTKEVKSLPPQKSQQQASERKIDGSGNGINERTVGSKTSVQASKVVDGIESKPHSESERDRIVEQVREAAITYDPASLPVIAPYLNSPDLELRREAVDAVVTLGDAAGAPLLRTQAAKETDQFRKRELLDLAAWLELPPAQIVLPKKKTSPTPAPR
jgi:hypothetical protein